MFFQMRKFAALVALIASPAVAQEVEVFLVEDPLLTDNRLRYPVVVTGERGYRIRCQNQTDEEAVIAGLGFLLGPSQVLQPTDPRVVAAAPAENPLLCPAAANYPITVFEASTAEGTKHYLQFQDGFDGSAPTDRIYIPGCAGLLEALNVDLSTATLADPTPFFSGKIHEISCRPGAAPIETTPQSFADWCAKEDLTEGEMATVKGLLDVTPGGVGALGNPVACAAAETFLSSIGTLNLGTAGIRSLAPVGTLTHLTSLTLSNNLIEDIAPLANIVGLNFLNLSDNDIRNITALSPLIALTELDLSGNRVSDLRALSGLSALQTLDLGSNNLGVLAPLQFLQNLKTLILSDNALEASDLPVLAGLPLLELLDVSDNEIENFAMLADFLSSVRFVLTGNPGFNVVGASFLDLCVVSRDAATPQGLTIRKMIEASGQQSCAQASAALLSSNALDLSGQILSDLTPLQPLTHLTDVNLSSNAIVDVTPLAVLTNVTTLDISGNDIVDVTPIGAMKRLTSLSALENPVDVSSFLPACIMRAQVDVLTEAQVAEINALLGVSGAANCADSTRQLQNATFLNLRNSNITTVEYLPVAAKARTVLISGNAVTSVAPLMQMPAMTVLEATDTQMSLTSGLERLRQLERLVISRTPMDNLNFVRSLSNLTYLDVRDTAITNVRQLAFVPQLETVILWQNEITLSLFMDYCIVHRYTDGLLGDARNTIAAIMAVARGAGQNINDCRAMQDWARAQTRLNLSSKQISNIDPLNNFVELTELVLRDNRINDASALRQLRKLKTLNLNKNRLSAAPLLFTTVLENLYLGENFINTTKDMQRHTRLKRLNLFKNRLTDTLHIMPLRNLAYLDLRQNRISDWREVMNVRDRRPFLKGNPMCSGLSANHVLRPFCLNDPVLTLTTPQITINPQILETLDVQRLTPGLRRVDPQILLRPTPGLILQD